MAVEGMCFGLCTHLGIVRFILADSSDGAEENPLRILVKVNAVPKVRLEVGQMVRLTNCEVRSSRARPDQSLPGADLVTNLCGLELGVNLLMPKRKRGQCEWLGWNIQGVGGWLGDTFDLEVGRLIAGVIWCGGW